MFEEMKRPVKEKDRQKSRAYATVMTNFGGLNVELYGDRAPKTVYNFVMLAKEGKYDGVVFHRLMPGFMVSLCRVMERRACVVEDRPSATWGQKGRYSEKVIGRAWLIIPPDTRW
jgi:hypothetical protein